MATTPKPAMVSRGSSARWASTFVLTRLLLVAASTVAIWVSLKVTGAGDVFPPSPFFAAPALLPVNLVCLVLVAKLLAKEDESVKAQFRPRTSVIRGVGWGLAWLAVLYVPFSLTMLGTMWLLHGADTFAAFQTVFFDPETAVSLTPSIGLALGTLTVLTFAPLNAPVEELVFRGYGQSRLTRAWGPVLGVIVPALVFGVQHAFFAPTRDAMVVYVAAFTVWGLGSAVIVRAQ